MSKVESQFHTDGDAEFRFALVLESRSLKAHSLMDSGDNKENLKHILDKISYDVALEQYLNDAVQRWREKYK